MYKVFLCIFVLLRIVSRTWPSYWESAFFFQSALFFLGVFFIKRETACFKLLFLKLSGRLPGEVLSLPSEFYGWHSALVPKFGRWGFPGGGRESSKKKNTTRVQGEINSVFFSTSLEIAEDKQNAIFSEAIFVVSFLSFFSNKNSQELQWLPWNITKSNGQNLTSIWVPRRCIWELPKHATTDSVYSAIAIRRAVATYQLKVIVPWPWGLDVLEDWGMCDTVDGRNPAPPVVSLKPYEKMGYSWCQLMARISSINSINMYNDMCHGFCLLKLSCYDMFVV